MRNRFLIKKVFGGSIHGTTLLTLNRKRKTSGLFLSQIPFNNTALNGALCSFIEFAVRLISRNKAYLRTNKVSCSIAVVETLSHPIKGDNSNPLTKLLRKPTMNTQTLSYSVIASTAGNTEQPNGISFIIAHGKPHSEAVQIARQAMDENPQFSEISVIPTRELERMNGAKLAEIENRQAIEPFNRNETEA